MGQNPDHRLQRGLKPRRAPVLRRGRDFSANPPDPLSFRSSWAIDLFRKARHRPLPERARMFLKARVYRQSLLSNLGLAAAVPLKKI